MPRTQHYKMLMHGFILVTILATASSADAELTMEAAFQGHCGHTSPCEQLCYEIHDGMYECDCIEGYELNKNGYSCQVINSTTSAGDAPSKSDEDVLYQKGASFSAKLANNNNSERNNAALSSSSSLSSEAGAGAYSSASSAYGDDNDEEEANAADNFFAVDEADDHLAHMSQQQKVNSNDYYISAESINFSNELQDTDMVAKSIAGDTIAAVPADTVKLQRVMLTTSQSPAADSASPSNTKTLQQQAAQLADNIEEQEEDYYSKQQEDMSVYDDVNNNQLNLRPLSHPHNTYQPRQQHLSQSARDPEAPHHVSISVRNSLNHNEEGTSTTATVRPDFYASVEAASNTVSEHINISNSASVEACNLDCGAEGVCDNSEGAGGQRCLCPFGKTGSNCLQDFKVRLPKFSRRSWLAFSALRGAYKHVQLRVEFRPESFDGIILLSGERDDLTGDFMALLLNKGFVEFWFDCGSGVGSVRSRETIMLNEWNSVIIYRHRWDAWLVLNHGTKVQGRSNGLFSRITFREPVFLGGTGNITGLAKRLPVYSGFAGCIRRFVANEHEYKFDEHPLGDVTKGFDIQDCVTDKCFKYPCQHGGKCLPSDQGAICLCPIGFVGDLCEIRMDLMVPAFNGSSFLRYAPLEDTALIWLELKVILKPEHPDGLVLYSGPEKHGDFIALSLSEGFMEFTFDLGSGPAVVRSAYPLTVGQWHTVRVSRTARLAVLKIDESPEVMTISSNGFWHLSLPENLFLGGVNHVDKLPLDLKFKPFFVGCIQRIDVNGHTLAIISEALGGTNIGNCPHACVARPCGPLAECVPQMESYECRCSALNAQCNKAAEVPLEELQLHKTKEKQADGEKHGKTNEPKHAAKHELKAKKVQAHKRTNMHGKAPWRYAQKMPQPTATTEAAPNAAQWREQQQEDEDTEDDIIFRAVHSMHKQHEHNQQAPHSDVQSQRNPRNNNNNQKLKTAKAYQEQPHATKHDRYHKHGASVVRKLSRLPTHYESFRTNPEGDILTFDEHVEVNLNSQHEQSAERSSAEAIADEPFVMDEALFDESDGTEEYQRKQLAQDMRRIMSNAHERDRSTQSPTAPRLVVSEYEEPNDFQQDQGEVEVDAQYDDERSNGNPGNDDDVNAIDDIDDDGDDDDLLEPVQKDRVPAHTTTPQTHTDWSLLKKLDLSADQQSQLIGVRKNFGACFAGKDSYFHYNDAETMSQIISYNIDLNLRIKTHSHDGVILWTGRQGNTEDDGDYLSLGIENGYLHFCYDLGSGELDIKFNMTKVSDGLWHRVRAIRNSQEGYLEVDGRKTGTLHSPGKLRQLNTDTGLYVGGMPELSYFTRRKYTSGIVGCISEIVLAGELKLNFDPNTLGTAHNVETGIL